MPLVAAVMGGAVTAAALTATGTVAETPSAIMQQGVLATSGDGGERLSVREIYERAAPAVVAIRARSIQPVSSPFDADGGAVEDLSTGSGFVVDEEGHVVTSARVVSGVTDVQVTLSDLRAVPATVVGKDEETDLAVLKIDPEGLDLEPLELADSNAIRPGDRAVAMANPSGLEPTAGTGTIASGDGRLEMPSGVVLRDAIRTDAVIEPAGAGGPLVGGDGRVLGVSSGVAARDAGLAAVIPADTAREVLTELRERHKVVRPYLGLRGRTTPTGVLVLEPYAGSPAERAGLQSGDVVESIEGEEVRSLPGLTAEVAERSPGDEITLGVVRDGARGEVEVGLVERPSSVPTG